MGQRAVLYARVSTSDQCCDRQERDLRAFAERGGYEIVACQSAWKADPLSARKIDPTRRSEIRA